MPVCCVPGCQSGASGYSHEKVQLFVFPEAGKAPQLRKTWMDQIGRREPNGNLWQPTENSRVCSKHFKEEAFEDPRDARGRLRKKLKLKPRAIPTEHLRSPPPQISNVRLKKEEQHRPGPPGEHSYGANPGKYLEITLGKLKYLEYNKVCVLT